MALEKILVPLDGSDLAEAALETAIDILNEQPAATLVLLRAAEAPRSTGSDRTDQQARELREAESYLNGVAAGLRECGIRHVKTAVWCGPAAPTIIEAAESEKIDLIVMSSHGRGGIGRLIFGSVAESVLYGTRTPILLVRDLSAPVLPLLSAAELRCAGETSVPVVRS